MKRFLAPGECPATNPRQSGPTGSSFRAVSLLDSLLLIAWLVSGLVCTAAEPDLVIDLGNQIKLELVLIQKGTFQQGSPLDEPDRNDDESPRAVTLTQDFYLGRFPVTRGQFARFIAATGYRTEADLGISGGFGFDGQGLVQSKEFTWRHPGFAQTDDHPVCLVTYNDALAFANWLSQKSGRRFGLPTEAQWEHACRAGSTTPYYNGGSLRNADEIAWHKINSTNGTQAVGQKKPNAWGVFDMSGNVHEWCRDWYGPYSAGPMTDPEETRSNLSDAPRRVLRGGSWLREPKQCRSAARYRNTPGSRNADNGFRVALLKIHEAALPSAMVPTPIQLESTGTTKAFVPTQPELPAREPMDLDVPSSFSNFLPLALLCPLGFIAVLFVLRKALSAPRQNQVNLQMVPPRIPPPLVTDPSEFEPRIGEDGFWLRAPGAAVGEIICYTYFVNGQQHTDRVRFEPGAEGQFIYTGGQPSDIAVQSVEPPDHDADVAEREKAKRPPQKRDDESDSGEGDSLAPAGFPPAY